jgi:hypothetical protein
MFFAKLYQYFRHDSVLGILVPGSSLFGRYNQFRRLALFLFVYNAVLVCVILYANLSIIAQLFPGLQRSDFSYKVIHYFEGLFRYVVWTAANYPLVRVVRRNYDASLYMTQTNPSLAMGIYFARYFFLASLVGSILYNYLERGRSHPYLYNWLTGSGPVHPQYIYVSGYFFMHEIALALFRATAVAYALFAGRNTAASMFRAFLGYALGALFLFTFYFWGIKAASVAIIQSRGTLSPFSMGGLTVEAIKMKYLIPYYMVCLVGGQLFLNKLRKSGKRSAPLDFEST